LGVGAVRNVRSFLRHGLILLALLATACTAITSDPVSLLSGSGAAPNGYYYALPRGFVEISLVAKPSTGEFRVEMGSPKFFPDPEHRYVLRYQPLPNYEDKITIKMGTGGRPFLKQVKADTKDKTEDVFTYLAKAAVMGGRFEVAGADETVLATRVIDPAVEARVTPAVAAFNSALNGFISEQIDEKCTAPAEEDAAAKKARESLCRAYQALADRARQAPLIKLRFQRPVPIPAASPADCTIGLCYRPRERYLLTTSVDGTIYTDAVLLPNLATPVAIDITRAFLVHKIQDIQFDDDGFFKLMTVNKPSELKALASLPLEIVEAIADQLAVRANFLESQKSSIDADKELIAAKALLTKARSGYEASVRKDAAARKVFKSGSMVTPSSPTRPPPSSDDSDDAGVGATRP
jgi:hypothetical protein